MYCVFIVYLFIKETKICSEGAKTLFTTLGENKNTITYLHVGSNNLDDSVAECISMAMRSPNFVVSFLSLDGKYLHKIQSFFFYWWNCFIVDNKFTQNGAMIILDGIKLNNSIKEMKINSK